MKNLNQTQDRRQHSPVAQPPLRVPFHLQRTVKQKLQDMLDKAMMERVEGPTPRVSIGDHNKTKWRHQNMCRPADHIQITETHTPSNTNSWTTTQQDKPGKKRFSKVDLNSNRIDHWTEKHHNFLMQLCTYTYKVVVMGITSAAEEGQCLLQQISQKCSNWWNVTDDILTWGRNTQEHNKALQTVLLQALKYNLTKAQHKSVFHGDEDEFHGLSCLVMTSNLYNQTLRLSQTLYPQRQSRKSTASWASSIT